MSTRPEGWGKAEKPESWQRAEKPEGWGKRAPSPSPIEFQHTEAAEQQAKQNRLAPKSATLPDTNEARNEPPTVPAHEKPQAQPIPEQPKITDEVPCIQSNTKSAKPEKTIPAKPQEKKAKQPKQKEAAAKSGKKKSAPKKAETAPKKKKLTVLWISLAALAVVGGILCWLLLQKGGGKEDPPYGSVSSTTAPEQTLSPSETQSEPTDPSETQPEPTDPSETQPEPTDPSEIQPEPTDPSETQPEPTVPSESQPEPVADLSGFAGCWHVSSDHEMDGGVRDRELYITRIDESTCVFNLWYYRLNSVEDVLAKIHGNTAEFSYVGYDGERVMEGSLSFGKETITLTIRTSDFVYMPAETIVFDGKHDDSWGYSSWPVPPAPEDQNTSPSDPIKTTATIEVGGVTFEYLSTCSYDGLIFTMNNITIEESYIGYSIKIDAEIADSANRRKYFTYHAYDADGYLLVENTLSNAPLNSGTVKNAYEIVVVYPMRPSYIYIGMIIYK